MIDSYKRLFSLCLANKLHRVYNFLTWRYYAKSSLAPMKKILFCFLFSGIASAYSQKISFNKELDQYCSNYANEFHTIPADRKAVLDELAGQLAKKRYVLFTCQTNSRRTVLLQTWAQTSFYYFGLWDRAALSIGDTVTDVYPGVANVLNESGFICTELGNPPPKGYIISISSGYENIIVSKMELGAIDTAKVVVVRICYEGESSRISEKTSHIDLAYKSPKEFENTVREPEKYADLNKQISIEMLYLAQRIRDLIGSK